MSLRNRVAIILSTALAGSCAHQPPSTPSTDPYVATGVAAIDSWFDHIPICAPATEMKLALYSPDATFVKVRGPLTLAANPSCPSNKCLGECCVACTPSWVVVPNWSAGPTRELAIQKSGTERPMTASVKECKLPEVRERIRKPDVVVSGWLESDPVQPKIIRASICVVQPPPAPPQPPAK